MRNLIFYLFAIKNLFNTAPKDFNSTPESTNQKWKITKIGQLPAQINESSGIAFFNGKIYTHGDSGNDPIVFELSYPLIDGETPKEIHIENAHNVDWEDISVSKEGILVIADCGNNSNLRNQFKLYRFDLLKKVQLESKEFKLPDQNEIPIKEKSYDFESIFFLYNTPIILSKERGKNPSRIYSISDSIATLIGTIPVNRMATATDFNNTSKFLFTLSYSFIYSYKYDSSTQEFIPFKKKKTPFKGQVEAICFIDQNTLLITNEKGAIYQLDIQN